MLLCAAALVSCGQPKQQQKAVADVVTSGNPIFEGWYADPEGIIYGDTYWVFPTWSDAYEKQTYFDCFSSKDLVNWTIKGHACGGTALEVKGVIERVSDGRLVHYHSCNTCEDHNS